MATIPSFGSMAQFGTNAPKYSVAKLDSTHFVIAYYDANAGTQKAVLASVSGSTITYGTPVQFDANAGSYMSVCRLDSTHFAIVFQSGGAIKTVVGVTDGNITINSFGTVATGTGSTSGYNSICALSSSLFVFSYRDTGNGNSYVVACSVSGSTITLGTRVDFSSGSNAGQPIPLSTISSSSFFCAYHEDGTNNNYAFVCSVSGTTITKGTDSKYEASGGREIQSTFSIDSTHIGIVWRDNNNGQAGMVIVGVISGTTISSWGTAVQFNAGVHRLSSFQVDSTNAVISYYDVNTGTGKSIICTISGTTPSFSAEAQFDTDSFDGSNGLTSIAVLDGTHFVTAFQRATSGTSNAIVGVMAFSQNYPITASQGSISLTGQTALLKRGRKILMALGTIALNGQTVLLKRGRKMLASFTTFVLNGQSVITKSTRKIIASLGSFTLTGIASSLRIGKGLLAVMGTFTLSGQNAIITSTRKIISAVGSFTLTGQTAILRIGKTMQVVYGQFVLTGQAVTLRLNKKLLALYGTFNITGQNALLYKGKLMVASMGAYILTGQSILLKIGYKMLAVYTNFVLSGQNIIFKLGKGLIASVGSFALTGQSVFFHVALSMQALYGNIVLTGQTVRFALNGLYIKWNNTIKNTVSTFSNKIKNVASWINRDKTL